MNAGSRKGSRSIGAILVANGRLKSEDATRIVVRQQQNRQQFGTAAVAMKLLTREDIDFALSQQFDYAYLSHQDTSLSPELVAAYQPFSRVGENLRALRSQLMLRWFNADSSRRVRPSRLPGLTMASTLRDESALNQRSINWLRSARRFSPTRLKGW